MTEYRLCFADEYGHPRCIADQSLWNQNVYDMLDAACEKMVEQNHLACEKLTEKQLADSLKQAILCGDFQRLITIQENSQSVIYRPFSEYERLNGKIDDLEKQFEYQMQQYELIISELKETINKLKSK